MMADVENKTAAAGGHRSRASVAGADEWLWALAAMAVGIAGVIALYFATAQSIVAIWERSDTYAHGFLIVPISLWLVWEKRSGLRILRPSPAWSPVLLLIPVGLVWLLSVMVDALVVQQYAFVAMLILTIWACLGHRVSRYLAFPLLFLLFAVPVGEGLIYPMINFTADFTVALIKFTGIPVYREGTFFTIPSGRWSVVEACSGVRYLIASVTLGALFAYLTYTRWWKRALFMVVAVLVPIVANGVRAYLIVMIAHLSEMRLAVGVDHLIYGWLFFGLVVTVMFLIGSAWRDPPRALPMPSIGADAAPSAGKGRFIVVAVLAVAAVWPVINAMISARQLDTRAVYFEPPASAKGWKLSNKDDFWDWRPRVTGVDGSAYVFYESPAGPIGLYVGIYRSQRQGSELVGSGNVMVPEKHPVWNDLEISPIDVTIGGQHRRFEQHFLTSVSGQRLKVWTWYRIAGVDTSNPYLAKVLELWQRLSGGGEDGALIAVAAPYSEDPGQADKRLQRFVDSMLPKIDKQIQRAVAQ